MEPAHELEQLRGAHGCGDWGEADEIDETDRDHRLSTVDCGEHGGPLPLDRQPEMVAKQGTHHLAQLQPELTGQSRDLGASALTAELQQILDAADERSHFGLGHDGQRRSDGPKYLLGHPFGQRPGVQREHLEQTRLLIHEHRLRRIGNGDAEQPVDLEHIIERLG